MDSVQEILGKIANVSAQLAQRSTDNSNKLTELSQRLEGVERALLNAEPISPTRAVRQAAAPQTVQRAALGTTNAAQLYLEPGGLFVDCSLERGVLNVLLHPLHTIANIIPVRPTLDAKIIFAYLTSQTVGEAGPQNAICGDSPDVGERDICQAYFELGRLEFQTNTMELDALILKAHRGATEDLFFIGDQRGISVNIASSQLMGTDGPELIRKGAIVNQMRRVGERFQDTLAKWLWTGDPTDVTQNGAGGGWRSFWGLDALISTGYAAKAFISGTNCASLDSDVKDFSVEAGGGIVGTDSIYTYLQEIESTLYWRAAMMGHLPVQWVIVMRPEAWSEIVKYLPCDMITNGCSLANNGVNTLNVEATMQLAMRRELEASMRIDLNGRSYPVLLDHFIPQTTVAGPPLTYVSDIFFIPLTVRGGESVLYWRHLDYTAFGPELGTLPNELSSALGWAEGGRFHWIINRANNSRCFLVKAKIQPGLVFTAPFLAGRINNVSVQPLQAKPQPLYLGG